MSAVSKLISHRSTQRRSLIVVMVVAFVFSLLPASVFAQSPYPQTSHQQSGRYHVVQAGDNLSTIASANGLSLGQVMQANGIGNPNNIRAGQVLWIPDNAYTMSLRAQNIHAGGSQPVGTPYVDGGQTYRVQPGDTLSGIAVAFGVNMWHLASINGIANPNQIYSGMILRIQ